MAAAAGLWAANFISFRRANKPRAGRSPGSRLAGSRFRSGPRPVFALGAGRREPAGKLARRLDKIAAAEPEILWRLDRCFIEFWASFEPNGLLPSRLWAADNSCEQAAKLAGELAGWLEHARRLELRARANLRAKRSARIIANSRLPARGMQTGRSGPARQPLAWQPSRGDTCSAQ